jgi:hypothetical protein
MEKWKQIIFAPKYEVSNYGHIRNRKTKRVLKPREPRLSHWQLTIFLRCGIWGKEQHTISQIVYNHWCLKENEKTSYYANNGYMVKNNRIGHLDGDIRNNRADNLYRY